MQTFYTRLKGISEKKLGDHFVLYRFQNAKNKRHQISDRLNLNIIIIRLINFLLLLTINRFSGSIIVQILLRLKRR